MVKLLKRINGKLCVQNDNKLYQAIELESLVHVGNELIGSSVEQNSPSSMVQKKALEMGQQYGCDYVMLGKNGIGFNKSLRDVPNYVYIATFYKERKKAVLTRIK